MFHDVVQSRESQFDVRVMPSDMYNEGDGESFRTASLHAFALTLNSIRSPCTDGPRESGQTRFVI